MSVLKETRIPPSRHSPQISVAPPCAVLALRYFRKIFSHPRVLSGAQVLFLKQTRSECNLQVCAQGPAHQEEFPGLLESPSCLPAVRIKVSELMLLPADFVLTSSWIRSGNLLVSTLSLPHLLLNTQSD